MRMNARIADSPAIVCTGDFLYIWQDADCSWFPFVRSLPNCFVYLEASTYLFTLGIPLIRSFLELPWNWLMAITRVVTNVGTYLLFTLTDSTHFFYYFFYSFNWAYCVISAHCECVSTKNLLLLKLLVTTT